MSSPNWPISSTTFPPRHNWTITASSTRLARDAIQNRCCPRSLRGGPCSMWSHYPSQIGDAFLSVSRQRPFLINGSFLRRPLARWHDTPYRRDCSCRLKNGVEVCARLTWYSRLRRCGNLARCEDPEHIVPILFQALSLHTQTLHRTLLRGFEGSPGEPSVKRKTVPHLQCATAQETENRKGVE